MSKSAIPALTLPTLASPRKEATSKGVKASPRPKAAAAPSAAPAPAPAAVPAARSSTPVLPPVSDATPSTPPPPSEWIPEVGFRVTSRAGGRVLVSSVLPDTPAAAAGLRVGDVIESVSGTRVGSVAEFEELTAGGAGLNNKAVIGRPIVLKLGMPRPQGTASAAAAGAGMDKNDSNILAVECGAKGVSIEEVRRVQQQEAANSNGSQSARAPIPPAHVPAPVPAPAPAAVAKPPAAAAAAKPSTKPPVQTQKGRRVAQSGKASDAVVAKADASNKVAADAPAQTQAQAQADVDAATAALGQLSVTDDGSSNAGSATARGKQLKARRASDNMSLKSVPASAPNTARLSRPSSIKKQASVPAPVAPNTARPAKTYARSSAATPAHGKAAEPLLAPAPAGKAASSKNGPTPKGAVAPSANVAAAATPASSSAAATPPPATSVSPPNASATAASSAAASPPAPSKPAASSKPPPAQTARPAASPKSTSSSSYNLFNRPLSASGLIKSTAAAITKLADPTPSPDTAAPPAAAPAPAAAPVAAAAPPASSRRAAGTGAGPANIFAPKKSVTPRVATKAATGAAPKSALVPTPPASNGGTSTSSSSSASSSAAGTAPAPAAAAAAATLVPPAGSMSARSASPRQRKVKAAVGATDPSAPLQPAPPSGSTDKPAAISARKKKQVTASSNEVVAAGAPVSEAAPADPASPATISKQKSTKARVSKGQEADTVESSAGGASPATAVPVAAAAATPSSPVSSPRARPTSASGQLKSMIPTLSSPGRVEGGSTDRSPVSPPRGRSHVQPVSVTPESSTRVQVTPAVASPVSASPPDEQQLPDNVDDDASSAPAPVGMLALPPGAVGRRSSVQSGEHGSLASLHRSPSKPQLDADALQRQREEHAAQVRSIRSRRSMDASAVLAHTGPGGLIEFAKAQMELAAELRATEEAELKAAQAHMDAVHRACEELRNATVYLGVEIIDGVPPHVAAGESAASASAQGVRVLEVKDGSAAAEAGLLVGDVITKVAGKETNSRVRFGQVIRSLEVGQRMFVSIRRPPLPTPRQGKKRTAQAIVPDSTWTFMEVEMTVGSSTLSLPAVAQLQQEVAKEPYAMQVLTQAKVRCAEQSSERHLIAQIELAAAEASVFAVETAAEVQAVHLERKVVSSGKLAQWDALKPYLGLEIVDVSKDPSVPSSPSNKDKDRDAAFAAAAVSGVRVLKVFAGQPAAVAGIRVGDLIVALKGSPTPNKAAFDRIVRGGHSEEAEPMRPLDRVEVTVARIPGSAGEHTRSKSRDSAAAFAAASAASNVVHRTLKLQVGAAGISMAELAGLQSDVARLREAQASAIVVEQDHAASVSAKKASKLKRASALPPALPEDQEVVLPMPQVTPIVSPAIPFRRMPRSARNSLAKPSAAAAARTPNRRATGAMGAVATPPSAEKSSHAAAAKKQSRMAGHARARSLGVVEAAGSAEESAVPAVLEEEEDA